MARRKLTEIVHYVRQLAGPDNGGPGDAELLERYVRHRDEAAFELLLWRHGALVLNVCRRVLHCEQDVEDAFQATFLAFVRKAHAIVRRGSVSSWLYKVAYRVAREARAKASKTAAREKAGGDDLAVAPSVDPDWEDWRPILDEEVNRLPERLRRPFVLCYLEGKTNEEAARQLGCRPGTVFSRLSRGREVLRHRLVRRGVTLSGAALSAALGRHAAEAAPVAALVRSAARNARLFAEGQTIGGASSRAVALAEGVLRTMFVTKIKMAALALFVVGLLATSGVLTRHVLNAAPQPEVRKEEPPTPPEGVRKAEEKKVAVNVVRPEPGGFKPSRATTGRVVAAAQQQVIPAVSGYLKRLPVDLGDRVKKGEVLAEIDAPLLAKDAEQAAASLELAKGQYLEAAARVEIAQAELQAARSHIQECEAKIASEKTSLAFREKQAERYRELLKSRSIDGRLVEEQEGRREAAREAVNAAQQALVTARAGVMVQESKIVSAKAFLTSAQASVKIAQVAAEKARIQLEFTRIRANSDGVVTQRNFDVGDYIASGEQGARRPLLTVQRTDRLRVVVDVVEADVPLTHPGIAAALHANALPGVQLPQCKVSRIGFAVDPQTGTMPVEIVVPNPKDLLRPGMSLRVTLELDAPNAVLVPRSCLVYIRTGAAIVFVVRDGKARATPVHVEDMGEDKVAVLSGLQAADLVVTDPKGVNDGAAVEVKKGP